MKSMHLVICISNLWYLMGIYKFIGFTEDLKITSSVAKFVAEIQQGFPQ